MSRFSRDRDREQLEQEIQGDEYRKLLRDLQFHNPFFGRFATWLDVVAFMQDGTPTDPRKDVVLRPIIAADAADRDPRWRGILLALFWSDLEKLLCLKRRWDPDEGELWRNITWVFIEALSRIDLDQRSDRLARKVLNDTSHRLHDEYQDAWSRANQEFSTEPEEIVTLAGGVQDATFAEFALREEQEVEIRRLRTHLEAGRITEADFVLLVGTRIYGQSVDDYARKAGLTFQTTKKRRQRAERAIRFFEKGMR